MYNNNPIQLNNIKTYLNKLFTHWSKLLLVRIDLYTKKAISQQTLSKLFKSFLNKLRTSEIDKHRLGMIKRIGYTIRQGWHIHLAIFVDGQVYKDAYGIGEKYRKVWENMDKDNLYSHNSSYTRDKDNACRVIDWKDEESKESLIKALSYFSKIEEDEINMKITYLEQEHGKKLQLLSLGKIKVNKKRRRLMIG